MKKEKDLKIGRRSFLKLTAGTDALGKAVLAAPVLGLAAAAVVGVWGRIISRKEKAGREE